MTLKIQIKWWRMKIGVLLNFGQQNLIPIQLNFSPEHFCTIRHKSHYLQSPSGYSSTDGALPTRSGPNVIMKLAMIFFEENAHFS